jgi:molybdopterin converting factor small subunit
MTVTFLGYIGRIAGIRRRRLVAADVKGLLETLADQYGDPWRSTVFDGTGLLNGVAILVNGTSIERLKGLATELTPGDEIVVLPQFEGG